MLNIIIAGILLLLSSVNYAEGRVDPDVYSILNAQKTHSRNTTTSDFIPIIVFLNSDTDAQKFMNDIQILPGVTAQSLNFMPTVLAIIPQNLAIFQIIKNHPLPMQISILKESGLEELENSAQSMLLSTSPAYPNIKNWWYQGFIGQNGVIGLIDSGVAPEHDGLKNKLIIPRTEPGSFYVDHLNGVRNEHGTGVACIYAGVGNNIFQKEQGIAYGSHIILSGFAGESLTQDDNVFLSLTTLDWMLTRASIKPTIINYSIGNGDTGCPVCSDWSGFAKIIDYVVNHEKILLVKSAGNKGFVPPSSHPPFRTTLTVPADNYNAITVANMNPTISHDGIIEQISNRNLHTIRYTSSRGPTLYGRRKPDISAPGHGTLTCAPDPSIYNLKYKETMGYKDGYRLMGGTSAAAPHVGAAILLLQDAGINNPIAAKALLINSADAWTDSGKPGPNDPVYPYTGGHSPIMGSEWNPTYGWGYINMQKAFDQRTHIIEDQLSLNNPIKEYNLFLPIGGKVTVVHERRVGYFKDRTEWQLSNIALEMYDAETHQRIAVDKSPIDNVHQVANCEKQKDALNCSKETTAMNVIIRVILKSTHIDGSDVEPFALVFE